jgi:hypothetical protein
MINAVNEQFSRFVKFTIDDFRQEEI